MGLTAVEAAPYVLQVGESPYSAYPGVNIRVFCRPCYFVSIHFTAASRGEPAMERSGMGCST